MTLHYPKHDVASQDRDKPTKDDPTVRAARRARSTRPDDGDAFVPDPLGARGGPEHRLAADDADSWAEEFIAAATTADDSVNEDARDEISADEDGGPFLVLGDDAAEDLAELDPGPAPTSKRPAPRRRAGA